jgi:hypothetical protein
MNCATEGIYSVKSVGSDCVSGTLEAVMNSIRNGLGMRET